MKRLKHEGHQVLDFIRAWDFQPSRERHPRYIEGFILEVNRDGTDEFPFAHYKVEVVVDTAFSDPPRDVVYVPMECFLIDWDTRVEMLSKVRAAS